MIRTVFIDVDNTLLDFHACARESMTEVYAGHGIVCTDAMFETFTRINDGLWLALERGELTQEELYRVRFVRIFAALGIKLDAEAFETQFRRNLNRAAVPVPGALPLLQYLSEKYTVCAASNAAHAQQLARLEKAGMLPYLKEVLTSGRIGAHKPGKEFFDACFALLPGARAEETVMIGDSLTADICGAAEYGLVTCWFDPAGASVPDGERKPDFIVRTLEEIKGFL